MIWHDTRGPGRPARARAALACALLFALLQLCLPLHAAVHDVDHAAADCQVCHAAGPLLPGSPAAASAGPDRKSVV